MVATNGSRAAGEALWEVVGALRRSARASGSLGLLLLLLLATPGCGGCGSDPERDRQTADAEAKAEAKKKELDKLPFDLSFFRTQPNDLNYAGPEVPMAKPGHWTGGTLLALANQADFSGLLQSEPLALPDVPFRLSSLRPIVLSKGQAKTIEQLLFVPEGYTRRQFYTTLETQRGAAVSRDVHGLTAMPAHQYFFVVLARQPDRYQYLNQTYLDFVQAPSGHYDSKVFDPHYRVIRPHVKTRTPLSPNPLAWSSIAYLLWDDPDLATITLAQQAALVDWLHWGGQLIVSGPDSLTSLAGSFLEPYLPAKSGSKLELTAEMLTVLETSQTAKPPQALRSPWPGDELLLQPDADAIVESKSGVPLVAERRIGNGRIVVTAFRLSQRELIAWDGCDAFFHSVLLRRPARQFLALDNEVAVKWAEHPNWRDPQFVTGLRFFSRDAQLPINPNPAANNSGDPLAAVPNDRPPAVDPNFAGLEQQPVGHSVCGWNSQSAVAQLAQRAGRDATRIEIPNSKFVVRMLALYLVVLVPVNWLVFRTIGRVEWAWIAAPVIALVGAVVVVRAAQLDIGFIRASNELATLEVFADYPRAHLTRYTSLYTSLSTNYDLRFADPTAVAQPFPSGVDVLRGQGRTDLVLDRAEDVTLRGFPILSNSVGIVHSEQMYELGGRIILQPDSNRAGEWMVTNGTTVDLEGAGVLQPQGAAWIGQLKSGESRPLDFRLAIASTEWEQLRERSAETAVEPTAGVTHLRALVDFAEHQRSAGEWRLVGWTHQELAGLQVEPRAAQAKQATLIVAHLRFGELAPIERDRSSRADVTALLAAMGIFVERPQFEPYDIPEEAPPARPAPQPSSP